MGCFSLFCFDPYRVTELRNKLGRWWVDGGERRAMELYRAFEECCSLRVEEEKDNFLNMNRQALILTALTILLTTEVFLILL